MPLHLYEGLSGRLLTTILKAKRFPGAQRLAVLQRLVKRLRHVWPPTWLIVRGDRHCASPELMPWMAEHPPMGSVTGLPSNAVVHKLVQEGIEQAQRASAPRGQKVTRFHATRSQAGTWWCPRRVGIKGEVSAQGVNPRFGVTNREQARTKGLSQPISWARGQAENESKDHTLSLKSARTAGHRCEAHPCRL